MTDALIFLAIPAIAAAVFAFVWWRKRIPGGWIIGPLVNGKNYSKGMPQRPKLTASGWRIEVPPTGEPHYVTRAGTLPLRVRYRVTGQFTAVEGGTPAVSFHFHQKGDDWRDERARWYSREWFPLTEGEHEAAVQLVADQWVNVMGGREGFDPDNIGRGGLVFGNTSNRGHGVRGPGVFEVLELLP